LDDVYLGYETMLNLSHVRTRVNKGKRMKIIAVDVDGVLANLDAVWRAEYNKD
jgi:hypothetical protein